jgi:hypothetical protein
LSVGLLDKTLIGEVRVARAFWVVASKFRAIAYLNPASGALLSANYPPCLLAFWMQTEAPIFGKDPDHEIESGTEITRPTHRRVIQVTEIALKSPRVRMCCTRARPAKFAWEMH